jgi:hypothetical protein
VELELFKQQLLLVELVVVEMAAVVAEQVV